MTFSFFMSAFAEADKNNDGRLDFEEFKDLMVGVMEVTDEDVK